MVVLAGLAVITTAAWVYLVVAARRMTSGSAGLSARSMAPMMHAMTRVQPWTAAELGLRLAMWVVMMVARSHRQIRASAAHELYAWRHADRLLRRDARWPPGLRAGLGKAGLGVDRRFQRPYAQ